MKLFFGLILIISLLGCETLIKADQSPFIDVKLIGVWKGEYLEEGGLLKRWKQTRQADGSYVIKFSFTQPNGTIQQFEETGHWWVQNDLFHEITIPEMKHPDKYRYSSHEKNCIRFILVESDGVAQAEDSYVFSECLEADSPPINLGESI